jgi:photosystem II stability/assembly factor-like uncharacterized protein
LATAGLPAPCVAPQEDGVCNAHSIAVDTAGTIYAPIGSSQISTPGGYRDANVGLYRLVAGASSWEQIAVPQDFLCTPSGSSEPVLCSQIPLVATGPDDSIYIVASGQHAFSPQDSDGLYRSTDGGQSWQLLPRSTDEMPVLDALAVGPDGRIWLGGGYVFSVFVHYILTSGDGGQTWEFSKIDPSQEKSTGHAVTDIAFHGGSTYITTRPAAGAGTEGHPVGVYRTDDGGRTWVQLTEDNPGQFMQALAVAVNGDIYHSQWGGIRRSTDGGATWQEFTATDSYIYALAIDYNGVLWVGTESGLFRTGSPIAPPSEPPVRSTGTSGGTTTGGTTTGPGEGTIRTGAESDQFKSDCFAADGAYYELGDGSHGCLFPDGSELDCSAQGACQLADPVGIIIAPRGSGR